MKASSPLSPRTIDERLVARATDLAAADLSLIFELVTMRHSSGLSVSDVADTLGWSAKKVRQFEQFDRDPRLSQVRRYALAVGAVIAHTVEFDPPSPDAPAA